jgi:palmitoyltransferase
VIYGNTRVVRRLLIEGADRSLPDGQGKTPLEVARESNFRTIAGMLDQEYSCLDLVKFYCNVKLEYIPKKRKYTVPIIFLLTTLLNVVVINVLLFFAEWYPLYI